MQYIYYTIAALVLYFLSDWILVQIEKSRGSPLKHRSAVFFAIILVLAVSSFKAIEMILAE